MKRKFILPLSVALLFILAGVALAQSGGGYDLEWSVIGSGGDEFVSGGGYQIGFTLAQAQEPLISPGGSYQIIQGYWQADSSNPALEVSKWDDPDPVQAGEQLTYTLRVTNTGNVDLHATITDTLPLSVTPGGVLTWTPTITVPDGVWTETVVVTVEVGYEGTLTNVVQVTTDEGATGIYTETSSTTSEGNVYLPIIMKNY